MTTTPNPMGCARCGIDQRGHAIQAGTDGTHTWQQPSQEQIRDRMRARSAQRPAAVEACVIAYRSRGTRDLYCVICARQETDCEPVTDADEQATCNFCGGRVHAIASRTLGSVIAQYLPAGERNTR